MSDEEQKPLVRVDIPTYGSKKAAFLAFRRWAEKVVAEQGNTMDPGWYSTYPKEEEPPEAETPKASAEPVVGRQKGPLDIYYEWRKNVVMGQREAAQPNEPPKKEKPGDSSP